MARVVLVFDDEFPADGTLDNIGVRLTIQTDRSGDPPDTHKFPATPAMLFGKTAHSLFECGALQSLIGFVVNGVMTNAGLTPEQQADCERRAREDINNGG